MKVALFALTFVAAAVSARAGETSDLKPKFGVPGFETKWSRTAAPDRPQALFSSQSANQKGWKALRSGELDTAIKQFNQAWTLWEDNSDALWGMALVTYERTMAMDIEKPDKTIASFNQAVALISEARDLAPDHVSLLIDVALLHTKRGGFRTHLAGANAEADFAAAKTTLITAELFNEGPLSRIESIRESLERFRGDTEAAEQHARLAKKLRAAEKKKRP